MTERLAAGVAAVDITPAPGSMMAAFPRGPERVARRAEGAHDPLQAKVLVLRCGEEAVAVCCCDLCVVREVDLQRVRSAVAQSVPELGGRRVVIACSHTHSSPEVSYLFGNTPDDPYVIEMDERIAGAVVEAARVCRPVEVSVASAMTKLNHNRRVLDPQGSARMALEYAEGITTGLTDPEVTVLRFDAEDGPLALLYHFTAHALTAGPRNDYYTADYPGVASREVERAFPGATALFVNGAAGNVHPRRCMRDDFLAMEEVGAELARHVIDAASRAGRVSDCDLAFGADVLRFPNRMGAEREVEAEVACLSIGDVRIGFLPGEPFVEFQLEFKSRVRPATGIVVGYANNWVGYIPTRDAFEHGGYGVDKREDDPPQYSRTSLPPGAGEQIVECLLRLSSRVER